MSEVDVNDRDCRIGEGLEALHHHTGVGRWARRLHGRPSP